jgi:predicted metal-dependent phosphoesterase TrpH
MGIADLHMHSRYSDGLSSVEDILQRAEEMRLDMIALTDHDTMDGVEEARSLSGRYGVAVIPGCEISTRDGHLVALFLKHPVQKGLPLADTLRLLREQRAVAFGPHLFEARLLHGLQANTIAKILSAEDPFRDVLLGVEIYGGGNLLMRDYSARARALADLHNLAHIGSSDSHQPATVGQYVTQFKGRTTEDLYSAMLRRQTSGVMHNYVPDLQIWLGFALYRLRYRPLSRSWLRAVNALLWKIYDKTRGPIHSSLSSSLPPYQDREA